MQRIALAGLVSVFLAVGVSGAAWARAVTEAEFLSALDGSHPAVVESAESLDLARARVVAASIFDNPVLAVVREDPNGPVGQTDWTLSWRLPGANRRPTISARKEVVDAEAARHSQQLLALRLTMKEIYAEWALASARHERLSAQAERVEALADRERLRAERGESSGLEVRRLDLAASGLRARIALAAAAAEQARARAAGWSPTLPPDAHPVVPAVPGAAELGEDHPLVRAAASDLAAATLERQAADRFISSPEVSLGWQRQDSGSDSIDGPILGVAWSVPVLGRNRAEKTASEARVSAARARLERVRRGIETARAGAQVSFQGLATALADAEAALGGNPRMLDGTEAAFRHGEASLMDLLDIHRSVTESELMVLELHKAALAAYRDLERAIGPLPERTLAPSESQSQRQENQP